MRYLNNTKKNTSKVVKMSKNFILEIDTKETAKDLDTAETTPTLQGIKEDIYSCEKDIENTIDVVKKEELQDELITLHIKKEMILNTMLEATKEE